MRLSFTSLRLGLALLAVVAGGVQAQDFTLVIYHNNDGESQILPEGEYAGVARFVAKLNQVRAADDPSFGQITVSSGDNFLAGAEFNASLDHGVPFYDTLALQAIGYSAVALGNHDFDFGPDVLADFFAGYATMPTYVSCNLDFSGEPRLQAYAYDGRLAPSVVVTTAGEQVAIIGATTEMLSYISSPRDVIVYEVAPAVQARIDALTAAGINKIILISHLQSILEDVALAGQIRGLDLMVAGGGDDLLANPTDLLVPGDVAVGPYPTVATDADGHAIPVITTAGGYRYVGRCEVTFNGVGEVLGATGGPVRVVSTTYPDGVLPDPAVQAQIVDPVQQYVSDLATTVIANSDVDLDGVRSRVRTEETNEGNLCADALLWNARRLAADYGVPPADVALQNGGGIRNNAVIPAGPVTLLDTWNILPFANFLSVVENVPRAQVKEILENAVCRVEFVDGRFAQVGGLRYRWDPAGTPQVLNADGSVATPGTRVIEAVLASDPQVVLIEGGVVVPGPALTVATIDFLARGGDQYPFRNLPFTTLGLTYQQTLQTYLLEGLQGQITAGMYPEGGEGRIVTEGSVGNENDWQESGQAPAAILALAPNYPNPFNPQTTIAFSLPQAGHARLSIYDVTGRLVRTLLDGALAAGPQTAVWDGTDAAGRGAASGTYLYRLETSDRVISRAMVLAK